MGSFEAVGVSEAVTEFLATGEAVFTTGSEDVELDLFKSGYFQLMYFW